MPNDVANEPDVKLTKSGNPRKAKRVDVNGKPLHRLVLTVSDDAKKAILKAVALHLGSEFAEKFVFAIGPKEECLGTAISEICEDWASE
jgi:hypothetical protein